jgi:YHS domain-containing protein
LGERALKLETPALRKVKMNLCWRRDAMKLGRWMSVAAGLLGLALWTAACGRADVAATAESVTTAAGGEKAAGRPFLRPVAKDEVCMVQKYFMASGKLTPVPLDGKTYWVCCQGCKNTITQDPQERWAVDPVSGRKVNKADAVLGRAPNDSVLFFENEKNRDAFVPTPTPPAKG